jgi:hypothetical protein
MKKVLLTFISLLFMAFLYLHFGHNWQEMAPKHQKLTIARPSPDIPPPTKKIKKESVGDFKKEKMVETYLDTSGLWAQLSMPQKILNKHLANPLMAKKLNFDNQQKIKELIQEKLGADAISQRVKGYILSSFSPEELQALLDIFSTPLMKKVASLEEYLSSEDLLVKANSLQLTVDNNSERAKLLTDLESIKAEGESSFLITLNSIKGLHKGFSRILPREKRIPEQKVNATLAILKRFARPKFKNLALIRYDHSYKELSNSELREYISVSQNQLMLRARKATIKGIIESFNDF